MLKTVRGRERSVKTMVGPCHNFIVLSVKLRMLEEEERRRAKNQRWRLRGWVATCPLQFTM